MIDPVAVSNSAGELLLKVLPLAVGAAISPTILIVVLLTLGSRSHPRARGAAYTAGALTVLLVITVVSLTLLHRSTTHRAADDPLYGWIDLGFGVLLVLIGLRTLLRPPAQKQAPPESADQGARLIRYFGIGVLMMLTNFSTLALYMPAMKETALASVGTGTKVVTVIVTLAIASVLAWAPVLLDTIAPRSAGRILDPLNAFMTRRRRAVTVVVCFAFAVYLIVKGARVL